MIKGKTTNGFEFEINKKDYEDNWELVEVLSEIEENPARIVKFVRILLGDKQYKALKEHNRKDGKISSTVMNAEASDIFKIFSDNKETKNS